MDYLKDAWLRIVLTVFLLWQVWANSHWSVAISITLMFVGLEILAYHLNRIFGK